MKYVTNRPAAQGDILIIPCASIPKNVKPAEVIAGKFVIAHSETGHHHVIERAKAEVYESADSEFVAYIRTLGDGAEITHERTFHTHEALGLEPNKTYEVRRQREGSIEAWRKAAD